MALSKKGKNIIIIIAVVLLIVMTATAVGLYFLFSDEKYNIDYNAIFEQELLFEDNFDGDSIDITKWNPNHASGYDGYNDKPKVAQRRGGWWTTDNVIVEDGTLKLRTNKVDDKYYLAGIDTNAKFESNYGYFEIKCKLPKAYGIWSAFWLLNNEFDQPEPGLNAKKYGAEVDIIEAPCYPKSKVQQAIHKGGYGDSHTSIFNPKWTFQNLGDIYDNFHTYGVFINEDIYKFYIDGKCVWTTSYNNDVTGKDMYMILSVETGNSIDDPLTNPWVFVGGKQIDYKKNAELLANNADFVIDYVKVYDVTNIKKI